MEISSFAEMTDQIWAKIKRPCVGVYYKPETETYVAKIIDSSEQTGITMEHGSLKRLKEDIRENVPWLEMFAPGAEDDPDLVCVYV